MGTPEKPICGFRSGQLVVSGNGGRILTGDPSTIGAAPAFHVHQLALPSIACPSGGPVEWDGDSTVDFLPGGRLVSISIIHTSKCTPRFGSAFAVNVSKDCGRTWTASAKVPPQVTSSHGKPLGLTGFDREETAVDRNPVQPVLYLLFHASGGGHDMNVILRTSAGDGANVPQWATAAVLQQDVHGFPAIAPTEASLVPIGSALWVFSCNNQTNAPVLVRLLGTATGAGEGSVVNNTLLPPCGAVSDLGELINIVHKPQSLIASLHGSRGLAAGVPIRLMYTGLDATNHEIIHVEDVAVDYPLTGPPKTLHGPRAARRPPPPLRSCTGPRSGLRRLFSAPA